MSTKPDTFSVLLEGLSASKARPNRPELLGSRRPPFSTSKRQNGPLFSASKTRELCSTSKRPDCELELSCSKPTPQQQQELTIATLDSIKLNLESKLDEVATATHTDQTNMESLDPETNIYDMLERELDTNFYELEEELIKIDWKVEEHQQRCRQPVAWLLHEVSYFFTAVMIYMTHICYP